MTITLYHADYSTCSQKVRFALEEKAISFTSKVLSFAKEDQLKSDYLAINPNGVVPTLVHDEKVIIDSSCILEYLEDVFPETPLSSSDPYQKAQMRAWLRFIDEVPTVAIRVPSFEDIFLPTMRIIGSKKSFEKSTKKRTLRNGFYKKMNSGKGFSELEFENSINQLQATIAKMEIALEKYTWLSGNEFSLVDIAMAPLIDRMNDMGLSYLWSKSANVERWLGAVYSRSSFQTAFYKGSRLSERLEFKLAIRSARKKNKINSENITREI